MILQSVGAQYSTKPSVYKAKSTQKQSFGSALPSSKIVLQIDNVLFFDDLSIMLKEPKNLYDGASDILSALKKNKSTYFGIESRLQHSIKMAETPKFKKMKMNGVIGFGDNSVALSVDKGRVLSISRQNPFYGRFVEDFDLPVLDQGYSGSFYYNLRPEIDNDKTTYADVQNVIKQIEQKRYKIKDLTSSSLHQVCNYQGKSYLLDAECARR
ncbi:MAG: hypothetical protein PHE78_06500 [Candidatus Gastranaerophilales bacterium]|nr:hypothetical protein [Candidatus Gastranaerophilales bacterium]